MRSATEAIMASRDRSMSSEDDFARDLAGGGRKVQAFFLHAVSNCLKDGETAVSFVQVKDAREDAHGLECAESADSEQQFLANAGATIAAV